VLYDLCATEADPDECRVALRCRELADSRSDCAQRVESRGCDAFALKSCYLSCAKHDLSGLLGRYRSKITVRTRKFGLLDEDGAPHGHSRRRAGALQLPSACWYGTVYDEPPAATCKNGRAHVLGRLRKLAETRCEALEHTTPRAGMRRRLPMSDEIAEALPKDHKIHVLPVLLEPKVRLVEAFITADEAAHIIKIGLPRMHRSLAGGRTESIRTSTTAMLPGSDPIVAAVTQRAAYLSGYPAENIEPLQLVKYVRGQKYEPHFDYGAACDYEENLSNGHRHVTMLVYLSSLPDEYLAHTHFPKLAVKVTPTAHDAIVFNDCLPNGQEDPRTLHGGAPPTNGTKIAINIWIRAKAFASKSWFNL